MSNPRNITKFSIVRVPYNFQNDNGETVEGVSTKIRYRYGEGKSQFIDVKVPKDHISILNFLHSDIMDQEELSEKVLIG